MASNSNRERGNKGEELAIDFLKKKGFEILEQNYRHGRGEVDIISKEGEIICFIEVKFRRNSNFGHPEDFVSKGQERSIITVAENYLNETNWNGDIRFDIIAIDGESENLKIEHFVDAFY